MGIVCLSEQNKQIERLFFSRKIIFAAVTLRKYVSIAMIRLLNNLTLNTEAVPVGDESREKGNKINEVTFSLSTAPSFLLHFLCTPIVALRYYSEQYAVCVVHFTNPLRIEDRL